MELCRTPGLRSRESRCSRILLVTMRSTGPPIILTEAPAPLVVFVSSAVGLLTVLPIPAYAASKHAMQSIAEAMYQELKPFGIQVQTINPGPYLTGFNETVVEAGLRWLNDDVNFIKREAFQKVVDGLLGKPEERLHPRDMIAKMGEVIPSREGRYLNIFPPSTEDRVKGYQKQPFDRTI
jgi:NAD(P)-dependent dehydrogenase (short-subunit alcohol dehydrogenase family)